MMRNTVLVLLENEFLRNELNAQLEQPKCGKPLLKTLSVKEKIVPTLEVKAELIGKKMHRLEIFHNGKFIGEYERSQKKDIERKTREISLASDLLMDIYQKHGEFVVRWDGTNHKKSIRIDGIEVNSIPKECWRKPSWV